MLYLLPSAFILVVSFFLFRRAAGSLSLYEPNMISYMFYYSMLLQTVIASVLVVLNLDNHYAISQIGQEVRVYAWFSILYLMIAFPMGMLLAKYIFARGKSMRFFLTSYTYTPINTEGVSAKALKYSVWVFSVFSILACFYTFFKIGYFPFIKALASSSSDLAFTRISVSRNFSGNVYIRNFFALTLMPILSYVWFSYYTCTKKKNEFYMFLITFLLSISILYYDFSKGPVLFYILSFLFVYYYVFGRVSAGKIILLIVICAFGLVVMYSLADVPLSDFISYNSGPVGRTILGQSAGLYFMFEIFPDYHEFIGFNSISSFLSNLLGYEYVDRSARIAMTHFNPVGVEAGTAGVMNSIFIAEAWANFGIIGVIVSPLYVGFIVQSLYIFFLKSPKNPLYLAFFVSFSIGGSITGGFNDYFYNPGVILLLVAFLMIIGLAKILESYRISDPLKNRGAAK